MQSLSSSDGNQWGLCGGKIPHKQKEPVDSFPIPNLIRTNHHLLPSGRVCTYLQNAVLLFHFLSFSYSSYMSLSHLPQKSPPLKSEVSHRAPALSHSLSRKYDIGWIWRLNHTRHDVWKSQFEAKQILPDRESLAQCRKHGELI